MAYYTVRYSYATVRTRLEFSETDLRVDPHLSEASSFRRFFIPMLHNSEAS